LLRAAADHVRKNGGRIVEGYPVEPRTRNMPDVFAWTGIASAYRRAGFIAKVRRSATRAIMTSVSLLTGTITKPQRTIHSCASRTTERGTVFYSRTHDHTGCCFSCSRVYSFRYARQPKSGTPTKADNTQTGSIELR
jgi:hypothetical protein